MEVGVEEVEKVEVIKIKREEYESMGIRRQESKQVKEMER